MKKPFLFCLAAVTLFGACSTDLDVNANWKDVTVVFGLLDVSDTAQYVKVNKAFLGDQDAFVMAQEADSLYYADGAITVELIEYVNGNETKTISLTRDESIEKEPGTFASPNQVLFKTTEALNPNARYEVRIVKGGDEGDVVSSITSVVNDFSWRNQMSNPAYKLNLTNSFFPVKVEFSSAEDGRRYEGRVRFHYVEENRLDKSDTVHKMLEWDLSAQESDNTFGGRQMDFNFPGQSFYRYVESNVEPNSNVWRHPRGIDIVIDVAGDEFSTYLQLNGPSNTLAQDKPAFTNIENGEGLFSSRLQKTRENMELTDPSLDSLQCGQFTQGLSFVTYEVIPANNQVDTIFFCQ